MFEQVALITLDLDETLWPCRPVIQAAEKALFEWLREHTPLLAERYSLEDLREHRLTLARTRPEIAHDPTEIRRQSLSQLMHEHGYGEALASTASDFFLRHRNHVEPFVEVPEVLARLRERVVLVSVTNGNAQIDQTPLSGLFHFSLTAADVGAAKPDPAMFEVAIGLAGVSKDQCLHVGDDPFLDIEAARAVGIRAVWVNRLGQSWPQGLSAPEVELEDLAQLENVLR